VPRPDRATTNTALLVRVDSAGLQPPHEHSTACADNLFVLSEAPDAGTITLSAVALFVLLDGTMP